MGVQYVGSLYAVNIKHNSYVTADALVPTGNQILATFSSLGRQKYVFSILLQCRL